jgi:hypothetical protein
MDHNEHELDRKPFAMFPHNDPTACVCCRRRVATSPTDGTCDECTLFLADMVSRKMEEQSLSFGGNGVPSNKPRPPTEVEVFDNDSFSVDASSLRQSGASSLCNINSQIGSTRLSRTAHSSSTSVVSKRAAASVISTATPDFVDGLLSLESSISTFGSTLRNHGYRLVVNWGLAPLGTNIPSILAKFVLPSGVSAALPKKFFTEDPKMMLQNLSLLRNQFSTSAISQQVELFGHEIILVKAAFNKVVRDFMKLAMLEFSRDLLTSSDYVPATRLTNLDDLEVELRSNTRSNWLTWYQATVAHHTSVWRKGGAQKCNLDLLTMRGMQLMGIDYRCHSNESGGGCFRRAATRVFHNLSTHLKSFMTLYKAEMAKVRVACVILCDLVHSFWLQFPISLTHPPPIILIPLQNKSPPSTTDGGLSTGTNLVTESLLSPIPWSLPVLPPISLPVVAQTLFVDDPLALSDQPNLSPHPLPLLGLESHSPLPTVAETAVDVHANIYDFLPGPSPTVARATTATTKSTTTVASVEGTGPIPVTLPSPVPIAPVHASTSPTPTLLLDSSSAQFRCSPVLLLDRQSVDSDKTNHSDPPLPPESTITSPVAVLADSGPATLSHSVDTPAIVNDSQLKVLALNADHVLDGPDPPTAASISTPVVGPEPNGAMHGRPSQKRCTTTGLVSSRPRKKKAARGRLETDVEQASSAPLQYKPCPTPGDHQLYREGPYKREVDGRYSHINGEHCVDCGSVVRCSSIEAEGSPGKFIIPSKDTPVWVCSSCQKELLCSTCFGLKTALFDAAHPGKMSRVRRPRTNI